LANSQSMKLSDDHSYHSDTRRPSTNFGTAGPPHKIGGLEPSALAGGAWLKIATRACATSSPHGRSPSHGGQGSRRHTAPTLQYAEQQELTGAQATADTQKIHSDVS
jgi:hypothetical protein